MTNPSFDNRTISLWFFLLALILPCFSLSAQELQCPIEVTEGPCFGIGNPCATSFCGDSTLCFQFTEEAKALGFGFGAIISYNFSDLTSGSINFDDFLVYGGCDPGNEWETRKHKTSRRTRPSTIYSKNNIELNKNNVEDICDEWNIYWDVGDDGVVQQPNGECISENPCQYVIIRVINDGSPPPIPVKKTDLVFDGNDFLYRFNYLEIRSNPSLFFENSHEFAFFDFIDDAFFEFSDDDSFPDLPLNSCLETRCTTINRTWTIVDWCGNETTVLQEIRLMDEVADIPCNRDTDQDGVCNYCDMCPGFDDNIDSDHDEVPDGCDLCLGNDAEGDTDGDGICNDLDFCANGSSYGSPCRPDGCDPIRLLTPQEGDVLDNGCDDRSDPVEWYFKWTPFPFAEKYHLYVIGPSATIPLIDNAEITDTFYHEIDEDGYIINANAQGWTVQVRAFFGGIWTAWTPVVTFDVESLNTDCEELCFGQDLSLNSIPIAPNTYRASNTIQSAGTVCSGSEVEFLAESVRLQPGFKSEPGSKFHAAIDNCQPAATLTEPTIPQSLTLSKKTDAQLDLSVFPNPFSRKTTIRYVMAEASEVSLFVTNFSGRRVETLISKQLHDAGTYDWIFFSESLSPGIYLVTIRTGEDQINRRMVLAK